MEKARIVNGTGFGGVHPQKWIDENQNKIIAGQLVSEWELTSVLPNPDFKQPEWNGVVWVEAYVEVIEVPKEISAMDLKLQLFDLGITDQDVFDDIDSIPDSMFPVSEKQKAKIKYKTAAKFERYNDDLNLVAAMEGITQEQLDQIFINGNLR